LLAHPCSKDKKESAAIATKPLIKTFRLSIFLHSWTNLKIMTPNWLKVLNFRTTKSTKLTKESDYDIEFLVRTFSIKFFVILVVNPYHHSQLSQRDGSLRPGIMYCHLCLRLGNPQHSLL